MSEVTKFCSTIVPITMPSTSAATGKPLRSIMKPSTPNTATSTTAKGLLPMAKAPTAQSSRISGIAAARGARRTWREVRIIMMPSGIIRMLAMMNTM